MPTSIDYINNLKFDYLETYSFQRGEEYDAYDTEYKMLRDKKIQNLSAAEKLRYKELGDLLHLTKYLTDNEGTLHPTSVKTNTFHHTHSMALRLVEILQTEIQDVPAWMCAPFYRDGLVFYNKDHNVVSILNICLGCDKMILSTGSEIDADTKAYQLLKQFFVDCGHEVEER